MAEPKLTFIQPVSESDISKGQSSLQTPTSQEEAARLDKLRSITFSSGGGSRSEPSSSTSAPSAPTPSEPTTSVDTSSLREQYIQGATKAPEPEPVSEQPKTITASTSKRVQREQLSQQEDIRSENQTIDPNKFGATEISIAPKKTALQFIEQKRQESRQKGIEKGNQLQRAPIDIFLGASSSGLSTIEFGKQAITKPKQATIDLFTGVKNLFTGKSNLQALGQPLREEGAFSTGFIFGELATGKGFGAVSKAGKTKALSELTKLSPQFAPVKEGAILVETSKGAKDIKLAGGVSSTAEPLAEQAKLAGTTVEAVSAQRGLFGRRTKEIIVDKPLPTPDSPLLEKSFFADPRGRVRQSRLGIVPEDGASKQALSFTERATELAIGDITFTKQKPQILIFPETKVSKLPSNIKSKLSKGKPLTTAEAKQLEAFQLTPSGEFKPVGFLSIESEITLAPGEIITKQKRVGVTVLEGKRVSVFEAGIKQPSAKTSSLILDTAGLGRTKTLSSALVERSFVNPISAIPGISKGIGRTGSKGGSKKVDPGTPEKIDIGFESKPSKPVSDLSKGFVPPKSFSPPVERPTKTPISPIVSAVREGQYLGGSGSRPGKPTPPSKPRPPIKDDPIIISFSPPPKKPEETIFSRPPPSKPNKPFSPSIKTQETDKLTEPIFRRAKKTEKAKEFTVQVRRKGEFTSIFKTSNKDIAFRTGASEARGRSSASFRVLEGQAVLSPTKSFKGFKASKREKGVLIEESKFRINTPGELAEITLKGIRSDKEKKKKKKNNLFF